MTESISQPKPHWDFLPAAGSQRQPCKSPCQHKKCACHFWFQIYSRSCCYCGLNFGTGGWPVMVWGNLFSDPQTTIGHFGCYEEWPVLSHEWLRKPTVLEAAAKKAGISIAAFKNFNTWDQDRLVSEQLETVYPDWQHQIKTELARRRNP